MSAGHISRSPDSKVYLSKLSEDVEIMAFPTNSRNRKKYEFYLGQVRIATATFKQDDMWHLHIMDEDLVGREFDTVTEIISTLGELLCLS